MFLGCCQYQNKKLCLLLQFSVKVLVQSIFLRIMRKAKGGIEATNNWNGFHNISAYLETNSRVVKKCILLCNLRITTRPWKKKSFCHVEKHKQWKSMPKDWVAENLTKCKNVLLLRLVRFFATQTLLTLCTYVAYSWSMKPALLFFWNWTQLTK